MDMEIADYERLVKELNQKLTHKSSQLEDLEQEISIQKQKQDTLQQELCKISSVCGGVFISRPPRARD